MVLMIQQKHFARLVFEEVVMTIKVIKVRGGQAPAMMGLDRLPESYRAPARDIVAKYADKMALCRPYHLGGLAVMIRRQHDDLESMVDADLLQDFHEISLANKPSFGATLYRLEQSAMPV